MPFAQVIVGPPGSGKSTYCSGMQQFLQAIGRKVRIVNLDAANENLSYSDPFFNICNEINFMKCMQENSLGPNGTMVKCMEMIYQQRHQILKQLLTEDCNDYYYLFDIPGQIELITNYKYLKEILNFFEREGSFRFCIVNLIDSLFCCETVKYIFGLLTSLKTMLNFEFPFVNVMTKIDLLDWKELKFSLEFYSELQDPLRLLQEDKFTSKFSKLNEALYELISDFGLIKFIPLAIEDKEMMLFLVREIDRANGFAFGTLALNESIKETLLSITTDYHEHLENVELKYNLQAD